MTFTIHDTSLVIDGPELDIYDAIDLKDALVKLKEEGVETPILDLSKVLSISTPAIQVILSAQKSFKEFKILGEELHSALISDLKLMEVEL